MTEVGAILLAGGRAARLGGAPKPRQTIGGRTLFDIALAAASQAGCDPIVAVGPPIESSSAGSSRVIWTREVPPFGGPAAGVFAALAAAGEASPSTPGWTLLLACDLPRAEPATALLLDAVALVGGDVDGVCLGDENARPQWLIGCYRTAALQQAADRLPAGGRDAPVRALLEDLAVTVLRDPAGLSRDVDTWEDLNAARCAGEDG